MTDRFDPYDLAPGDVLLYRGASPLSSAIRFFDGSEVSHVSLNLGRGQVAEALAAGLTRRGLDASLAIGDWALVRRLKDPPTVMSPVRRRALVYLNEGHRYAYEQIVLLAFLCLTRRLPAAPELRSFVRGVLDAAARAVAKLTDAGCEPMICSEFVYRCYDEASAKPNDQFAIEIDRGASRAPRAARAPVRARTRKVPPRGLGVHPQSLLGSRAAKDRAIRRRAATKPPVPSERQLEQQFTIYMAQVRSGKRAAALTLADPELAEATIGFAGAFGVASKRSAPTPFRSLFDTAADFVTPGDLLRSESLATLGKLEARARTRSVSATRRAAVETEASKLARVEAQIFAIVAKLTPGTTAGDIERKTRFAADLGWDDWSLLRLVRPVRDTFGVRLAAAAVKKLKRVGELVDAVWEKLEEEAS